MVPSRLSPQKSGLPSRGLDPKQRRLMLIALSLLLMSLGIVLYRDRDFWFPDTQEADDQEVTDPSQDGAQPQAVAPALKTDNGLTKAESSKKRARVSIPERLITNSPDTSSSDDPPFATVSERTALPALQVEVVAGDVHKQVQPGSNSVHVELQPESSQIGSPQTGSPQAAPNQLASNEPTLPAPAASSPAALPADVPSDAPPAQPSNASERVEMSADTADIVSRPVSPGYPLLARQMKVQGSVILQALIGRDGLIQNLRVISGPPILASAAEEAVMQWHFKPHYQGAATVETQAKITVNFTISTN